jgi:hypothetical protein
MRSILIALVIAFSAVSFAQADDVSGKGTGAGQKEACKAAQTQARGTTRKGINFEECQCTQADGKFQCTVKGATR